MRGPGPRAVRLENGTFRLDMQTRFPYILPDKQRVRKMNQA